MILGITDSHVHRKLEALCGIKLTAESVSRFLQTAEMLKPSTPSASHDSTGSSGADDGSEYYPHIGQKTINDHNYLLSCNRLYFHIHAV